MIFAQMGMMSDSSASRAGVQRRALGTSEAQEGHMKEGPAAFVGGHMITISLKGTTRLVLVIGPWALKFARGPRGRRCNRYEADLFRRVNARRREMLCPVRW